MTATKPDIEALYLAFANALLERMRLRAGDESPPQYVVPHTVFDASGWSTGAALRPFNFLLFARAVSDAAQLDQLKPLADALRSADALPDRPSPIPGLVIHGPADTLRYNDAAVRLADPVLACVVVTGSLEPSPKQLLAQFKRFLPSWTAGPTIHVVVPLQNLRWEADPVATGSPIELAALSPEEKTVIWNNTAFSEMFMTTAAFSSVGAALTASFRQDDTVAQRDVSESIPLLLTTLRLLKGGDVGAPMVLMYREPEVPLTGQSEASAQGLNEFRVRSAPMPYTLSESEVPQVLDLFSRLRLLAQSGELASLAVALRRFNQAYSRDMQEDQLLDLTISLEASLLFGVRDELSYRLAQLGAMRLAQIASPMATAALLGAMYEARSKIVHHGSLLADATVIRDIRRKTSIVDPATFVRSCETATRDVIKAYLTRMERGRKLKDINKDLASEILSAIASATEGRRDATA